MEKVASEKDDWLMIKNKVFILVMKKNTSSPTFASRVHKKNAL